jgi:hypothetical protein
MLLIILASRLLVKVPATNTAYLLPMYSAVQWTVEVAVLKQNRVHGEFLKASV